MTEPRKTLEQPQILNCIDACRVYDSHERWLAEDRRSLLVIHRTETGENAEAIAAAYANEPACVAVTGGEMPYTFVVRRDGVIEQALRVTDFGPHARAWSHKGIGVGVVGDFRREPPTPQQWHALVVLGHVFSGWLGGVNAVHGHDELPGASSDPAKQCPGEKLELHRLRHEIYVADRARVKCFGVAF